MNDFVTTPRPAPSRLRPLALGIAAACLGGSALPLQAGPLQDALRERIADGRFVVPPAVLRRIEDASAARVQAPTGLTRQVTNCDDSGAGSLRDTIGDADTDDTIDLSQLTCSRITLTSGAIYFGQENLAIDGPGAGRLAIDGNLQDGVLVHLGAGTLKVSDVSLENSFKYRTTDDALGGCIHTEGSAMLISAVLRNCNSISTGTRCSLGGVVFAQETVTLDHSIITGSMAKAAGNGYASGGGLYARNGIVSTYSTVSNNVAIGESSTPSFGGGMFAWNGGLILGTTISGNQSARMGGIATKGSSSYTLTMVNSTVSGNVANRVGGIESVQKLNLYNSTIAFNTSHEWDIGSGTFFGAGVHIHLAGEMDSTIIANNVNTSAPFPTADLTGVASTGFSGGHNNVMFCGAACPTDTSHEDPGLHPLQDNGGPTRTHVPTPGQWDTFGGSNVLGWTWDQRGPGFARQSPGDWPEIGALQINSDIIFANGFN